MLVRCDLFWVPFWWWWRDEKNLKILLQYTKEIVGWDEKYEKTYLYLYSLPNRLNEDSKQLGVFNPVRWTLGTSRCVDFQESNQLGHVPNRLFGAPKFEFWIGNHLID